MSGFKDFGMIDKESGERGNVLLPGEQTVTVLPGQIEWICRSCVEGRKTSRRWQPSLQKLI
jgi:hypothetical protein